MIKFLYKINKGFDRIPEPVRLLTFLAFALPGLVLIGSPDGIPLTIGVCYIMIITVMRVAYLTGVLSPKKNPDE